MNWEFQSITTIDALGLIEEYRQLAIGGIEQWLDQMSKGLIEYEEKQPEPGFTEFPRGFYHEGPSYSFRFRMYGPGGCLSPAEYDVKVDQTFYPVYDEKKAKLRPRIRLIQNVEAIS